jgi:predicted ribosome quality control (RQC) complex YloA/Tae2 family protein
LRAKKYLREIGTDRRNFPVEKLVQMYNDIKGTNEKAVGCKPCQISKFYNGLQNYAYFGELTLINNGKATKEELDIVRQEFLAKQSGFTSVESYLNEVDEIKEQIEDMKKEDIKERMKKVREAKKAKKEENNDKDKD